MCVCVCLCVCVSLLTEAIRQIGVFLLCYLFIFSLFSTSSDLLLSSGENILKVFEIFYMI